MVNSALDDFIKYAKEQYGCEIILKESEKPDTFEDIFGASFIMQDNNVEKVEGFGDELKYKNNFSNVCLTIENEI